MKKYFLLLCILFFINKTQAQLNPAITCWKINSTNATGFANITTNVQQVQYSASNVYISTNDIASWIPVGYNWPNNPWSAGAMNYVFKITLNPTENLAIKKVAPYGHIGVWTNGVSIYNPKDAKSFNDSNMWFQNAFYFEHLEHETFDSCLGHPNQSLEYHLHVNPHCLYDKKDSSKHSPILGYAFDGFPIYGAYGFKNTDGSGGITRMTTSYKLRNITNRTVLPNGTILATIYYGPTIAAYPLGAYTEDYEYVNGHGSLDTLNGRFCKTPEYPNGIYAYFVTIDDSLNPVYPYVLGPKYYGTIQMGNLGPNSGHNTITEAVTIYTSIRNIFNKIDCSIFPNPASSNFELYIAANAQANNMTMQLINNLGQIMLHENNLQSAVQYNFDVSKLNTGVYSLKLFNATSVSCVKLNITK
jgi:YHYH protein/Secretion system C-terminal sorting domain